MNLTKLKKQITMLLILLASFWGLCWKMLIPLLLGAWALGWLFWRLLNQPKYQNQIDTLDSEKSGLQNRVSELDGNLSTKMAALASTNVMAFLY